MSLKIIFKGFRVTTWTVYTHTHTHYVLMYYVLCILFPYRLEYVVCLFVARVCLIRAPFRFRRSTRVQRESAREHEGRRHRIMRSHSHFKIRRLSLRIYRYTHALTSYNNYNNNRVTYYNNKKIYILASARYVGNVENIDGGVYEEAMDSISPLPKWYLYCFSTSGLSSYM